MGYREGAEGHPLIYPHPFWMALNTAKPERQLYGVPVSDMSVVC